MSGGRFCHMDTSLKHEIFGFANQPKNMFEDREISELVFDVLNLIHDFDWYASGDTCEDTYLTAKQAFKEKWLKGSRAERLRVLVDTAVGELREELYKTIGLEEDEHNGGY